MDNRGRERLEEVKGMEMEERVKKNEGKNGSCEEARECRDDE